MYILVCGVSIRYYKHRCIQFGFHSFHSHKLAWIKQRIWICFDVEFVAGIDCCFLKYKTKVCKMITCLTSCFVLVQFSLRIESNYGNYDVITCLRMVSNKENALFSICKRYIIYWIWTYQRVTHHCSTPPLKLIKSNSMRDPNFTVLHYIDRNEYAKAIWNEGQS